MQCDPKELGEYIIEELTPSQLSQLGAKLASEVNKLGKVVAGYESDFAIKTKIYKLELAKAKVLYKDARMQPTMINAIAETTESVIVAGNDLQCAEALLLMGKAELDGQDKQYTMVKKIIDLKVQELRTFKG
jgi:hypothetical protein